MKSGYLAANGQRLYYEVHGQGEPLLLIMGLGGDATSWGLQVPTLKQQFQVIVFDNRDVGRSSPAAEPYTVADMAEDSVALLDGLGIQRAHILGASLGGAIAQEMALRHPHRLHKLILSCTLGRVASYRVNFAQIWRWLAEHDPDYEIFPAHMIVWCMTHTFQQNGPAVERMLHSIRRHPFPPTPAGIGRQTEAFLAFDALDRLGAVTAPTLVLVGEQDILTPPWAARELAAAIPGATLHLLAGGGHGFMWEIPGPFNRAVLAFLS